MMKIPGNHDNPPEEGLQVCLLACRPGSNYLFIRVYPRLSVANKMFLKAAVASATVWGWIFCLIFIVS